jgi:3-oxoacyl-[acyl-carrier-protein] synthase I
MSVRLPLAVVGFGMFTAVGNDGIATCAALRAGISGATRVNLWDYTAGEYLSAARVSAHQWWEGATMVAELILPPILECVRQAEKLMPGVANRIPILSLLPPPSRPYLDPNLDQIVRDGVTRKLDRPLPTGSAVIAEGRTGFLRALEIADAQFEHRPLQIVASAETFMRQ